MKQRNEQESSSDEEIGEGLFDEPEDYYKPPPEPTVQKYVRKANSEESA